MRSNDHWRRSLPCRHRLLPPPRKLRQHSELRFEVVRCAYVISCREIATAWECRCETTSLGYKKTSAHIRFVLRVPVRQTFEPSTEVMWESIDSSLV
jgi:hypothetical protein